MSCRGPSCKARVIPGEAPCEAVSLGQPFLWLGGRWSDGRWETGGRWYSARVTQVEQSCRLTQEPTNTQIHQRKVVGGAMLKVSNRHLNVGQLVFSQSETTPSQNKPRLSKLFVKSIFWVQIGPWRLTWPFAAQKLRYKFMTRGMDLTSWEGFSWENSAC